MCQGVNVEGLEAYDIPVDVALSGALIHLCFQVYSLVDVPVVCLRSGCDCVPDSCDYHVSHIACRQ